MSIPKTEYEKMRAFQYYYCDEPSLLAERTRAALLYQEFNATRDDSPGKSRRQEIYHELFATVGEEMAIVPPFFCDYGRFIHFGKKVYLNMNCVILDGADVFLGNYVYIGPNVHIYTVLHPWDAESRNKDLQIHKEVRIADNVWIGGGTLVLPGVSIGKNTVVGAGSVVTRSLPEGVFACGNPCRVVREIRENRAKL